MTEENLLTWFLACRTEDVPENEGVCVKVNDHQIALFNFSRRGSWYATDNLCPHRRQMALSRGLIGSQGDHPKVACPFHKRTFSLITGECLNAEECAIRTYPVEIRSGHVYIGMAYPNYSPHFPV